MTFEEITSRLQNVKHTGGNILASCPCQQNHKHGDKKRSLSAGFDPAKGRTWLYCFTGCTIDEICAALGISYSDLYQDTRADDPQRDFLKWYGQQNALHLEAVYNYPGHNDGMAKVRYKDAAGEKTFRWIHADASKKSGFAMGQGDCKHRLYMRGDLTADVVFLAEGEKDVDTVYNLLTICAACTENGAGRTNQGGKWRDEYTAQLAGKHVYILFDNDEPGRAFAEIEAAALQDAAAAVYMLDLAEVWEACPDGGDITDFVNAIGAEEAAEKLSILAAAAKPRPRSAPQDAAAGSEAPQPPKSAIDLFDEFFAEIQSEKYRPIATGMPSLDKTLGGGFEPQSLVMLGAAPGMGKTSFAQYVLESMAAAGHRIIYLNLEMSRQQLLARAISRAAWKHGQEISAVDVMRGYAWTDAQRKAITAAAAEYRQNIAPRMAYNPQGTAATLESIKELLENTLAEAQEAQQPAPLVCLDYLQLVQSEARQDAQETITAALLMLKDYAIKGNTLAFVVLAFNREANRAGKVSQESGRDTSSIEYSADCYLGLNYAAWENGDMKPLEDLQQEKPHRQLVLKVIKRRMGEAGSKLYLAFDGKTSRFTPIDNYRTPPGQFTELDDSDPLPDEWDTMPERSSSRKRR